MLRLALAMVTLLAASLSTGASAAPALPQDTEAAPSQPQATEAAPSLSLSYSNFTVIRLNPLGTQDNIGLDVKLRLFDEGISPLLDGTFVGLSLSPIITPGLARLGVAAKLRPLAIFKAEVRWDYIGFYGNFDLIQSYDDPNADFSDDAIADNGDAGLNYATDGWQVTLDVELRAKVWKIIVRTRVKLSYVDMALTGGDTVFYDQFFDLLLPHEGWFVSNDADLLVQVTPKLVVGVRHAYQHVFYTDDLFAGGAAVATESTPVHKLGPLVAYTFFEEPGSAFDKPTLLLLTGWYLTHRYRAGQAVSQAFPYLVVGFAFSGAIL